jgi:hypothetical protein
LADLFGCNTTHDEIIVGESELAQAMTIEFRLSIRDPEPDSIAVCNPAVWLGAEKALPFSSEGSK